MMRLSTSIFVRAALCAGALVLSVTSAAQAQWPQWGGKKMDFKADAKNLAASWSEEGPKEIWRRDLGSGYSAILMDGGRLYTMYRSDDDKNEIVIAIDPKTGKTIWEHRDDAAPMEGHVDQFGRGPRSTPLIVGDRIFAIGVSGRMHCLNKSDGKEIWSKELWQDLGGTKLSHGYSSSPVAYKDTVITLVGAEGASIVAFNQADGSIVWKKHDFANGYSTPILIQVGGRDQMVTFMDERIVGFDPTNGDLEWELRFKGTNMAQPVWNQEDGILFVSALSAGARGLKLTREDGKTNVEEVWSSRKMQLYHVNPIAVGDYVYGSSGNDPAFFAAINHKTGEVAWRKRGFAQATAVYADGRFVVLDEDGKLGLVEATPEACTVRSEAPVMEKSAWTVPTINGSTIYVRDNKTIRALDLSSGSTTG